MTLETIAGEQGDNPNPERKKLTVTLMEHIFSGICNLLFPPYALG